MLKKITLDNLKNYSLEEISKYKDSVIAEHSKLIEVKEKGTKEWTKEMQNELDWLSIHVVDIEELIEDIIEASYKVKPGTEKMVHLSLVQGRRFNPNTGKEESKPFLQLFTFSEWQLFKKNFSRLGYIIVDVLHDPYNDAKQFIVKQ